MKTKIVTAFYSNIEGEPYFGQSNLLRHKRYLHSIRVLNNIDCQIICYCSSSQIEELELFKQEFSLFNVYYKIKELEDFIHTKQIQEIKRETNSYKFYHEIDYGKFYILNEEFDEFYEYIYWIDVGISHWGLFPIKYNPNYHKTTGLLDDYNFFSYTNLFSKTLIEKLNFFCDNNLISLSNKQRFHDTNEFYSTIDKEIFFEEFSIGGFIGGNVNKLQWLISEFNSLASKCFSVNYVPNHELMLTYIRQQNLNNFNNFTFDTWYHRDIPVREKQIPHSFFDGKICFSDFFDQVLRV